MSGESIPPSLLSQELAPAPPPPPEEASPRLFGLPLYALVLIAMGLAVPLGLFLGQESRVAENWPVPVRQALGVLVMLLDLLPTLILRALKALAAPLVVLAILSAIVTNEIHGRQGLRMMLYYLVNTMVAMVVGLALTNVFQPGREQAAGKSEAAAAAGPDSAHPERLIDALSGVRASAKEPPRQRTTRDLVTDLVPQNLIESLLQNNIAQLVVFTLAAAIGLSQIRDQQRLAGHTSYLVVEHMLVVGFELLMKILLWVVALVPLAVFGVVATSLAREGIELFRGLGLFILTVLSGLLIQFFWYLTQLGIFARMSPRRFLTGAADVMATTFSTASTAATIPVTLGSLQNKLGVSRQSSQLAACVGTNFNNDGTALYQAVAALYFAQIQGVSLDFGQQLVVVLTTLVASVGAGGIPSGSFVTMPLILASVQLSADQLPLLLTIDWFLDRCRTTSNVVGDMTVAILLDRTRPGGPEAANNG